MQRELDWSDQLFGPQEGWVDYYGESPIPGLTGETAATGGGTYAGGSMGDFGGNLFIGSSADWANTLNTATSSQPTTNQFGLTNLLSGLAGVAVGTVNALKQGSGNPTSEAQAVQILNQLVAQMQANTNAYWNGSRTTTTQAQTLQANEQIWQQIQNLLSNPSLGSWGTNGLRDRQRGGKYDLVTPCIDAIAADHPPSGDVVSNLLDKLGLTTTTTTPGTTGTTPGTPGVTPTTSIPSWLKIAGLIAGGIILWRFLS